MTGELVRLWLAERRQARETGRWEEYIWFLKDIQFELGRVYVQATREEWITVIGQFLQLASCELQEIIIKSNNQPMEPKKKAIPDMTDTELLDSYIKGVQWLREHEEQKELHNLWELAIRKIERLETEMQKRSLAY